MKKIEKIAAAAPANREIALNGLLVLIRLFSGHRVHVYDGWSKSGGRYKLMDATGVKTAKALLSEGEINYTYGNDAPRGGMPGRYMQLPRRSARMVAELTDLYREFVSQLAVKRKWSEHLKDGLRNGWLLQLDHAVKGE